MNELKPRTKRDIARDYRAQGLTYKAIGELMGISDSWAYALCNDERYAAMMRRASEVMRSGTCVDCGGPMTLNKHGLYAKRKPLERCRPCWVAKTKADALAANVKDDTIKCNLCHTFKPFADYPQGVLRKYLDGNCRQPPSCRACGTAARADYRRRNSTPCTNCGNPRYGDEAGRRIDTGLCLACYLNRANLT